MIAVIADDFTGAAEIGGIGLRYGLKVVIETGQINGYNTDLLVVATDTRSMNEKDAAKQITHITKELLKLNPDFIYKKTDSVLRGNIAEELTAQMYASNKRRAVIIAGNPVFNRIIQDGIYYIDNIPLHETSFSNDPQLNTANSVVVDIINQNKNFKLYNRKCDDVMPEEGLIIGDITCNENLNIWINYNDKNTLLAGASSFFNAILNNIYPLISSNNNFQNELDKKSLFIMGSTYPKDANFYKKLVKGGFYLSNMPKEIYYNKEYDPAFLTQWATAIIDATSKYNRVVVYINHPLSEEQGIYNRIKDVTGKLVKKVISKVRLNNLLIEGGSTTFTILYYLGIAKLFPEKEYDTGVIRMKVDENRDFYITTKPGSYNWPEYILMASSRVISRGLFSNNH